ncbi:MAG: TRAFs-binding domain-containing protein, partial [Planctomycetota bacterium JB042]
TDSPLHQLVEGFPDVQHHKTDVFRERVDYSRELKARLAEARKQGVDAVREVRVALGSLEDEDLGVLVDLFLSFRAVEAWDDMIALQADMPSPLGRTVMIREQLGLALNRAGRDDEAERVLEELIEERGPSSETYGILGRVHKDRWQRAREASDHVAARGHLRRAVAAYRAGFEADWRDAYPGVNAVTLMEVQEPPDPERTKLVPVVRYAVERRVASGRPDYWDHATRLELAVLGRDEEGAEDALADALPLVREPWEPKTTLRNLRLIREARERRGDAEGWERRIEDELDR